MLSPPKKYVCGYCARAFTRSEHKQRHERSHTNEKPFHCSYCTSAFVRRDLLQRHCRTVHNIRLVSRQNKDTRVSKGGLVVSLETWKNKPMVAAAKPTATECAHTTEASFLPDLPQVLPRETLAKLPVERLLKEESQPVATEGLTPRTLHAYPGPAHTAANARTHSPGLDTEPNVVASAKALLQLAPNHEYTELQGEQKSDVQKPRNEQNSDLQTLGTPFAPSALLDINQVLLLAKSFEQYYFPEDLKYQLCDFFLLGYSSLANESYNTLPISHADIASYNSIFSQGQPHTFKVGLAYTILAAGCLCLAKGANHEQLASEFINKARENLIEKSVSSQNSPQNQLKLLSNLYLLTNVYIGHFKSDCTLSVLEDTTHNILPTLPPHLVDSEMDLLWKIYILVSGSKTYDRPPLFFSWFLARKLNGRVLVDIMRAFALGADFATTGVPAHVITCTLSNELNSLVRTKLLWIYLSRLELHSALGNVSKMINTGPDLDVFKMFRRKLILGAPAHSELLESSLFEISSPAQVSLLSATLRELDAFDFHLFLKSNLNSPFSTFVEEVRGFFEKEDYSLSGNFALVSFSLIFNETFLNCLTSAKLSLTSLEKCNFDIFILQWYAVFVKTLVKAFNSQESQSFVFQALVALIKEKTGQNEPIEIISIFEEATRVCDAWLQQSHLGKFRQNLFHFSRELMLLTINQGKFNMNSLHGSNESLLLRNRSRSIGSLEIQTPILPTPFLHSEHNYVLKGTFSPKATAQFSPLGAGGAYMDIPTILPPLHASLRNDQPPI